MMFNLIRAIDIFKTPINITYKNYPNYTTTFSAFISLLVLLLISMIGLFYLSKNIATIHSYLEYEEDITVNYPTIPIAEQNFTMGIKIIDETMEIMTYETETLNSLFDIRPLYISYNDLNKTYDVIDIPYKSCQEIYTNISNMTVGSDKLIGAICPYNFSFPIFGNTESGDWGLTTILIYPCANSTSKIEQGKLCKSIEEIRNSLSNTIIQIIYIDNIINLNDYNNPIEKSIKVIWDFLDYFSFKNIELYIKPARIDTDKGLVIDSIFTNYGVVFDPQIYTKSLFRDLQNPKSKRLPLFQIDLKVINKNIYSKRTDEKIQKILSNISQIIKFVFAIGLIFTILINKTVLKFDIVNDFFDYSEIYQSDIKNIVNLRKLARSGIMYSNHKVTKINLKKSELIKKDYDSKSDISAGNKTNQLQGFITRAEKDEEKTKLPDNKLTFISEIQDKNHNTKSENKKSPKVSSIELEKDYSSSPLKKVELKKKIPNSSLKRMYSNYIKKIGQSSSSDISNSMVLSRTISNRVLDLPENENKSEHGNTILSKNENHELYSLSEEYLLRKKKNSVLYQLNYTTFEILKLSFPFIRLGEKLKKKSENLEKSYEKVMNVLDISSLMQIDHQINLIKGLILNEDQIRLTNYTKNKTFTESMLNPNLESELTKIKNYYNSVNGSGSKKVRVFSKSPQETTNKKLIENLEEDLLFILKN